MNRNFLPAPENSWPITRRSEAAGGNGESYAPGPGQLDFAMLVRIVSHWRWLIVALVAFGLIVAIIATVTTTPIYRSWVTLEVSTPTVEIMDEQTRGNAAVTPGWDVVATQVGLLSSRSIAERAAQDLNLASNEDLVGTQGSQADRLKIATSIVQGGLKVEPPADEGQLIRFSFDAESAELSAAIANQIADSFINSTLQRRYEASAYARAFLEKQIVKARQDLEKSERQLVAYAQSEGIISTASPDHDGGGDTNSLQGESLVALNRALADATARRVAAEGAYRQGISVGATADVTQSTQVLRQQRAVLEAEYQDKLSLMKPEHPEMLSLRARIDELGRQITREQSQSASGRSNSLLADYRAAAAAERALQSRVVSLKGSVLNLRGRSIQYNILQREVDTNRSLYDALLQRYKEVGVASGIGASPVAIVDRAEVPGGPYKPNLMFNLAAGLGVGLLAGLLAAIVLELVNDTIKTRDDVRTKLKLACLGAIPKSSGRDDFAVELRDPKSNVSEAYAAVAASLRFSTEEGLPKCFLITSTRSGEGKSSTSLALAQNFSRRGARVLLVDCDLRKPAFKAGSDKIGLSRLLTGDNEAAIEHTTATQHEGLFLLPSGPLPPNPADLLSTGRFHSIIGELQPHFDIMICDAPPVLGLADLLLMAPAVGNVVMVVESGKTRTSAALETLRQIDSTGVHILGAILNKSTDRSAGYGYRNYSYGYGKLDRHRTEIPLIPHEQSDDSA